MPVFFNRRNGAFVFDSRLRNPNFLSLEFVFAGNARPNERE